MKMPRVRKKRTEQTISATDEEWDDVHSGAKKARMSASPRARVPPMDYADKLTPKPVVHFYAAAPVHNPAAVDIFGRRHVGAFRSGPFAANPRPL